MTLEFGIPENAYNVVCAKCRRFRQFVRHADIVLKNRSLAKDDLGLTIVRGMSGKRTRLAIGSAVLCRASPSRPPDKVYDQSLSPTTGFNWPDVRYTSTTKDGGLIHRNERHERLDHSHSFLATPDLAGDSILQPRTDQRLIKSLYGPSNLDYVTKGGYGMGLY